ILMVPSLALSAYDQIWGARLDLNLELPEVIGSSIGLNSENTAILWYQGRWTPAANIELSGGVQFDAYPLFGLTNDIQFSYHGFYYTVYPNLDKLNFYGNTGMFGYKAGRQLTGDPAGLILDAPFDGIDFSVDIGKHVFTLGAGYTGLTIRESAEYFMTLTDVKRDSMLAAPRIMESLAWDMPAAASWLNLSLYFLAVQDLTSPEEQQSYGSGRFNSSYLELYARGFLGESFLYDLSLVGQYGTYKHTTESTVLGGIGRLGLSWLTSENSRLGLDVIASTGDDWGRNGYLLGSTTKTELSQYLSTSIVSTQGFVLELELGNLTSFALFYAQRPSKTFSWEMKTTTLLRTAIGPVSTGLVPESSTGHFIGQEGLVSFTWRPKSDFGWDFNIGVLYPGEAIVLDSEISSYFPVLYRLGFDWSWSF
ncbi:MAG: hypothetical protein KAH21_13305, partial [Spirochaetaceae bacterium]|nr:hypothetical protein [Spirochaetaceae bacterium]